MTNTPTASAPSQVVPIEQALQIASQHQAAGQLEQAETILKQILRAQPRHAFALHLLGVIAHQSNQKDLAIQLVKQAIEINPSVAQFHSNLCEMLRQNKQVDEAIKHGKNAVRLDKNSAEAQSNLGIAYYDARDYLKAKKCQRAALKLSPEMPQALNNLGSILRQEKDREGAIRYFRKALQYAPNHLESINNLGAILTEDERPDEAVGVLLRAIKLKPDYAEAHCNIGCAFLALENLEKAQVGFNQALKFRPDYAEAHEGLAKVYREQHDLDATEREAKLALEIAPDRAEAHCLMGNIYTEKGFPDLALEEFEKALTLDNNLIGTYLGKGQLLMQQGKLDESEANFRKAIELDKGGIAGRLSLAQLRKTKEDDENVKSLLQAAEQLDTMPEPKAMSLHFALGKVYDDNKEYDLAFPHFLEGCRLKRKRMPYDVQENNQAIADIMGFFSKEKLESLRGAGDPSDLPIFVLGMPRSGTTLTETIIASHPDVYGAGELPDLMNMANNPSGIPGQKYPMSLHGLTKDDMAALGARYVDGLRSRNPEARRITDKMPANFFAVGLIHLILPNAKIVHVNRNPLDTCLSCFSRMFNTGQNHTYNLTELGLYYRNYARLMDHWRKVLPEGAFYDLQYEQLVTDNETQARHLIEFCGLEWNDACLESHKNKRSIRTASVTQVREPVYTSSVERWRRYDKFLGPLKDALGDLIQQDAPQAG
jgi:tetratricopeptide (TPR) repeat protein